MKIDGKDIVVFAKIKDAWYAAAYGTTCELDVRADIKSVSSPDTGKWQKTKKGRYAWNGSSGYLVAARRQRLDMFEMLAEGADVLVAFATTASSTLPRDFEEYTPDGRFGFKGNAILTRMTVTGRRGDAATFSISFKGVGALQRIES